MEDTGSPVPCRRVIRRSLDELLVMEEKMEIECSVHDQESGLVSEPPNDTVVCTRK